MPISIYVKNADLILTELRKIRKSTHIQFKVHPLIPKYCLSRMCVGVSVYTGDMVLLQSRLGVVHDKLLQKGFPLSVSGGSLPTHTPARFEMPAARGKTSLNARDW